MFGRTHAVLAVLLAAQLVAILVLRGPFGTPSAAAAAHPLLPALESVTPAKIEIEVKDGKALELTRREDRWTLPGRGGYPADDAKVQKILDDLRALQVRRPVVTAPRYHEALGVADDEHERRVRVWDDPSGDPVVDLLVGSSPKYRFVHVRRAGEDPVYEVMGLSPYDLRADEASFIQRKLIDVPFDDVRRLELENEHGRIVLQREEGQWKLTEPAGGRVEQTKADALVRPLCSLWIAAPVGPVDEEHHGFAEPAARVTIAWSKGGEDVRPEAAGEASEPEPAGAEGSEPAPKLERVTLLIGAPADGEASRRYATREGFGFTAAVAKSAVEKALEQTAADLK